MAAAES